MKLAFRSIRALSVSLVAVLSLTLGGCAAFSSQNPSSPMKPVNAVEDGTAQHLMLRGHDVVAYFTEGRHLMGSNLLQTQVQGVTFRFANAANKALFDRDPARYMPQYGGFCANGIVYGIPWGGDADTWRIVNGKLYIFGGQGSKDAFELDLAANIALADKYWASEVQGSNSFIQRSKRLVMRVPHYKNGEQLAKMVAEAKARSK